MLSKNLALFSKIYNWAVGLGCFNLHWNPKLGTLQVMSSKWRTNLEKVLRHLNLIVTVISTVQMVHNFVTGFRLTHILNFLLAVASCTLTFALQVCSKHETSIAGFVNGLLHFEGKYLAGKSGHF